MDIDWYRLYRSLDNFITMLVMPGLIEDYSDDEKEHCHNSEHDNCNDDDDDDDDNDIGSNNINTILKDIGTKLQVYLENNQL